MLVVRRPFGRPEPPGHNAVSPLCPTGLAGSPAPLQSEGGCGGQEDHPRCCSALQHLPLRFYLLGHSWRSSLPRSLHLEDAVPPLNPAFDERTVAEFTDICWVQTKHLQVCAPTLVHGGAGQHNTTQHERTQQPDSLALSWLSGKIMVIWDKSVVF